MSNELIVIGVIITGLAGCLIFSIFSGYQKRKKYRDYVNKYIAAGPGFYYNQMFLEVPESVYYPREDSLLLAKHLERQYLKGKKCLDMGCGSGFFAILMAKKGGIATAADVNPGAVETTMKNAESNGVKVNAIISDTFSKINGVFDFIAFNPPYLPSEDTHPHKDQWSGGKTGRAVIEKFLSDLKNHLNNNGNVLMVFSSLTGEDEVRDFAEKSGFSFNVIEKQKMPWEELILAEIAFKI